MCSEEERGEGDLVIAPERAEARASTAIGGVLVTAAQVTSGSAVQVLEAYGDALEPSHVREFEQIRDRTSALAQVPAERQSFPWAEEVWFRP